MTNDCGIIISPGCINKCVFCGGSRRLSDRDLRPVEEGIAKDLVNYVKEGYSKIEISGCDPLEYTKIASLVAYIKKLGILDMLLNTHGIQFSDENLCKDILKAGLNSIRLPLYGSKAEIHDAITRNKGSFKDTVKGLKNIKRIDPSIKLMLHTLVLEDNKLDIFNIFKLASDLKMNHFSVSVACVSNKDYSYYVPYKDLNPFLKDLYNHITNTNEERVQFHDIPHCVFGKYNRYIWMSTPPDLGQFSQPREEMKSHKRNLPSYRLKKKHKICETCTVNDKCSGFYANDIDKFGTGKLKPIK